MKWIFIISVLLLTSFKTIEKPAGCGQVDIILVGDFSNSVCGNEHFIREAFLTFTSQFELSEATVKIGMIIFDEHPKLLSPLTANSTVLQNGFYQLDRTMCNGGTEMEPAFAMALEQFNKNGRENYQKILVLVSDGDPHEYDKTNYYKAVEALHSQYISVCGILITGHNQEMDRGFMQTVSKGCYAETEYVSLAYELKNLDICF